MTPSIEQIMIQRHSALRLVRFAVFALVILASFPITYWLVEEGIDEAVNWDGIYWDSEVLAFVMVFFLPACVLWMFQKRMSRWLVPIPKSECPQCGYAIDRLAQPRCPECGCELPASFVSSTCSDR